MKTITLSLSDERYAALTRAQELMLLAGGTAKSPEEYMQLVADGACDSYAAQYRDDTPEGLRAQIDIHKDAAARAEAVAADAVARAERAEESAAASADAGLSIAERLEKI